MLARSSPGLCSIRGPFIRSAKGSLLASTRANSPYSTSANKLEDADAQDAAVRPKRTTPMADLFGDIAIPSSMPRGGNFSFRGNSRTSNNAGLGDNELGGGSLAARLARRRTNTSNEQRTPEHGHNKQGGSTTPKISTARDGQEGSISTPPRLSFPRDSTPSQDGRVQRQNTQRRQRDGDVVRAVRQPAQRSTEMGNNQRERWNRDKPATSAPRPQAQQTRTTQPRRYESQARDSEHHPARSEKANRPQAGPKKASAAPTPLPMHIQTTDLGKLFGPSTHSEPSAPEKVTPIRMPKLGTVAARRIQQFTEIIGGDYSRYLPADVGNTSLEQHNPLGTAKLVMARKREAGLRMRKNALDIVQRAVVEPSKQARF